MRLLIAICCMIALACGIPQHLLAQMVTPWSHGCPTQTQNTRPAVRQPVPKTVSVTVPIPAPQPRRCPGPPAARLPYPAGPLCSAPPARKPMPVRVEVSVRPDLCDRPDLVPVVYRDRGLCQPIISNAVGLVGATIAAPFRLIETLIPVNCGPKARPRPPYPQCSPPARRPIPVGKCGPPACMAPPACAPGGPSVAPLPQRATPPACGPFIPPMLVAREEEPPCEPTSLLGGILAFPGRLLHRGRFLGDAGTPPACSQRY